MMAGHTMLKVFGGFVVMLGAIGGWAPLGFMVAFTGLEVLAEAWPRQPCLVMSCD